MEALFQWVPTVSRFTLLLLMLSLFGYAHAAEGVSSKKVLFVGDSLTAGYGIDPELAYPVLIDQKLRKAGQGSVEVINGSISGSTTASGLSRLKWYARSKPDVVVIALGANDGLRGVPLEESRKNLGAMVAKVKGWGATTILAGMKIPPNYGADYADGFETMFVELAEQEKLILIPFLLEGVAAEPELNLADGIHPNADGHAIMAETVYPYIKEAL